MAIPAYEQRFYVGKYANSGDCCQVCQHGEKRYGGERPAGSLLLPARGLDSNRINGLSYFADMTSEKIHSDPNGTVEIYARLNLLVLLDDMERNTWQGQARPAGHGGLP